jgi:hypothetical protein
MNAGKVRLAGDGDRPIGVASDEAEAGELTNVDFLGGAQTRLMVAATPVAIGDGLVVAAEGKVIPIPDEAGSYQQVGRALTSAAVQGERVEVLSCSPQQLVIA